MAALQILIDMNLSPAWVKVFEEQGIPAQHWSTVGDPRAPDSEIMAWARANGFTVFTHDLDFGAMLAATRAEGPSVLQVRTEDVSPEALGPLALTVIRQHRAWLERGALVVVRQDRTRVRILPLGS